MKKIILFAVNFFILFSCNNDDSTSIEPEPSMGLFPIEISSVLDGVESPSSFFSYNDKNQITQIKSFLEDRSLTLDFTYENGNLTQCNIIGIYDVYQINFSYTNNRLSSYEVYTEPSSPLESIPSGIIYNADNNTYELFVYNEDTAANAEFFLFLDQEDIVYKTRITPEGYYFDLEFQNENAEGVFTNVEAQPALYIINALVNDLYVIGGFGIPGTFLLYNYNFSPKSINQMVWRQEVPGGSISFSNEVTQILNSHNLPESFYFESQPDIIYKVGYQERTLTQ